jgi:hypothetical protein
MDDFWKAPPVPVMDGDRRQVEELQRKGWVEFHRIPSGAGYLAVMLPPPVSAPPQVP